MSEHGNELARYGWQSHLPTFRDTPTRRVVAPERFVCESAHRPLLTLVPASGFLDLGGGGR